MAALDFCEQTKQATNESTAHYGFRIKADTKSTGEDEIQTLFSTLEDGILLHNTGDGRIGPIQNMKWESIPPKTDFK